MRFVRDRPEEFGPLQAILEEELARKPKARW